MSRVSEVTTSTSSSASLTDHLKAITIQPNTISDNISPPSTGRQDDIKCSTSSTTKTHKNNYHKQAMYNQKRLNSQNTLPINKPKLGIKPLNLKTKIPKPNPSVCNPFTVFKQDNIQLKRQKLNNNPMTNMMSVYSRMESSITSLVRYFRRRSPESTLVFRHSPIMSPTIKKQQDYQYLQLNNEYITRICSNKDLQVWENLLPDNPYLLATDNMHVTPFGAIQQLMELQNRIRQQFTSHFRTMFNYGVEFSYFQNLPIFHKCQPSVSPLSILPNAFTFQTFRSSPPNRLTPRTIYIGDSQLRSYVPPSVMARFHPEFGAQVFCVPNCTLDYNITTVLDPILSTYGHNFSEVVLVIIQIGLPNLSSLKRECHKNRVIEEKDIKNDVYLKLYEPR